VRDASICGLGQTAANAIDSAINSLRVFEAPGSLSERHVPVTISHTVELEIDGESVRVREGATILDACRAQGRPADAATATP
jgi:hypothetical protein